MDNTIPCETCIVDNDMDLALAKLGSLLDQGLEVGVVEHIAGNSQCLASITVDRVGYSRGFLAINV